MQKLFIIFFLVFAGCSVNHKQTSQHNLAVKPNEFWWPNKINLSPLRAQSVESNPYGSNYNYAKEFSKIDIDALKKDIKKPDIAMIGFAGLNPANNPPGPSQSAKRLK